MYVLAYDGLNSMLLFFLPNYTHTSAEEEEEGRRGREEEGQREEEGI